MSVALSWYFYIALTNSKLSRLYEQDKSQTIRVYHLESLLSRSPSLWSPNNTFTRVLTSAQCSGYINGLPPYRLGRVVVRLRSST